MTFYQFRRILTVNNFQYAPKSHIFPVPPTYCLPVVLLCKRRSKAISSTVTRGHRHPCHRGNCRPRPAHFDPGHDNTGGKVYVAGFSFNTPECPAYCNGRSRASYWVDNGTAIGNDIFLVGMSIPYNGPGSSAAWRAFEGASTPMSLDMTGYYVANGYDAWGLYVR